MSSRHRGRNERTTESSSQIRQGSNEFVVMSSSVKWTIREYYYIPKRGASTFSSPQFRFQDADWRLLLHAYGSGHFYSPGRIKLCLRRVCRGTGIDSFYVEMSIKDSCENVIGRMSGECGLSVDVNELPEEKCVAGTEMECVNEDSERCHVLRVFCSISKRKETAREATQIPEGLDVLSQNLQDLLLNERLSDVNIRIENEEFRAHRAILAAHSPVFHAMLEHDTAEKRSGIIEIVDCSPVAFQEFLQYLYSGRTEGLSQENVCGVYRLADKYGVGHLRTECAAIMAKCMDEVTFCEIISLAAMHGEFKLIKIATDFFVRHVKSILPTVRWQTFMAENITMANELFLKAVSNLNADE